MAIIVKDGDYSREELAIVQSYCVQDKRIAYTAVVPRSNDFGHTPRELGKQIIPSDWVIMSGDDNYYTPTAVQEIKKVVTENPHAGMVYWDMVHSHYDYKYFKTSPGFNQIDIGAFATRCDLAKQIKLPTTYAADGEFVEMFKYRFADVPIVKIDKVLYVHN
jgi:hypothetical protein